MHHELWGPGSSSSDWDEAQAQDGQGRTGDDGQGGGGKVPLGQGRVGQVPVKLNWNSFLFSDAKVQFGHVDVRYP